MEQKNSIPPLGQGPAGGDPAAALFGRLDALNKQVNELLNDPTVRRMAIDVGIVLLSKKYPALGALLGAFGDTGVKQAAAGRTAAGKPAPVKKIGRGIR
jgi:hypothetical protein